MADWRDQLAELETALSDPGQLTCPVCRLAQPADAVQCARCGADLSLLAGVLAEAAASRADLYSALARGDAVAALSELDAAAQLTGPTVELAVLRRLVRCGTVPVEVLADPTADQADDCEPLAVYQVAVAPGCELLPDIENDPQRAAYAALCPTSGSDPERAAVDGLWPAAEADLEPMPDIEPERHPHHEPAPPPPPPMPLPPRVPAAPPIPALAVWIMVAVAFVTLVLGIGIGWMLRA